MPTIGRSLAALALLATVARANVSAPSSTSKRCRVRDRAGMIDALRLACANLDDETRTCYGARVVAAALERCDKTVGFWMPRGERGPDVHVPGDGHGWIASFGAAAAGGERTLNRLVEVPRD
jgi:hypothetical protein